MLLILLLVLPFQSAFIVQEQNFGPYPIKANEQFAQSKLSFAFVNLKPIVEGQPSLQLAYIIKIWNLNEKSASFRHL